jgi:RNA polymerase subunit RPABC4/transcription elongation factor Spt4
MPGIVFGKARQYRRVCPVCMTGATTEIHRYLAVFNPSKSASASVILDCDRQKHNEEHGCSSLTEVADEKE